MLELDHTFQLRDGRTLGWGEYGDEHGTPVFFFHGTPGSRRMRHPDVTIAEKMNVRIITTDRPGFGFSDPQPARTFLDWADDIHQLADDLGVDRFGVIGFSGGGPYALACAYKMPDRVTAVGLISSLAPPDLRQSSRKPPWIIRLLFACSRKAPRALPLIVNPLVRKVRRSFDTIYEGFAKYLPEGDRRIFLDPPVKNVFKESLSEAFRQGSHGFLTELSMQNRPWGFDIRQIRQKIYVWHGSLDLFHDGRIFVQSMFDCDPKFLEEGHLVMFEHWPDVLAQLMNHKDHKEHKAKKSDSL
jgi:pimeloyl-ACP methyl ester carboxylesterase